MQVQVPLSRPACTDAGAGSEDGGDAGSDGDSASLSSGGEVRKLIIIVDEK